MPNAPLPSVAPRVEDRTVRTTSRIPILGHHVAVYSYGTGIDTVLCLSGGPGMPCDYIRDSHSILANYGYRVVVYDQLGTGDSDRPQDTSLWTLDRYVEEVEIVRRTLDLGKIHLLGQSWGVWLGTEYCLRYPDNAKTYILANGSGEIPLHLMEMERLRAALGTDTVEMMDQHVANETTDHPEYQAALTILDYRHICRLKEWPNSLRRSIVGANRQIYETMWGINDYVCTGNLRNWDRLADLHQITQPSLVIVGRHDEFTPADARRMHDRLPNSELHEFCNSSHTPFFEEPEAYFHVLTSFLDRYRARSS